jgi:hypothetical protein
MEENAKEIERELRENIDLLQNQMREVCSRFLRRIHINEKIHFNRKNDKWNNNSMSLVIMNEQF